MSRPLRTSSERVKTFLEFALSWGEPRLMKSSSFYLLLLLLLLFFFFFFFFPDDLAS